MGRFANQLLHGTPRKTALVAIDLLYLCIVLGTEKNTLHDFTVRNLHEELHAAGLGLPYVK